MGKTETAKFDWDHTTPRGKMGTKAVKISEWTEEPIPLEDLNLLEIITQYRKPRSAQSCSGNPKTIVIAVDFNTKQPPNAVNAPNQAICHVIGCGKGALIT